MFVVAHISDLHFNGTDRNRQRVQSVLDYLEKRSESINALVITGDIADEGSAAQYSEAAATLQSSIPTLILPGNHDRRDEFGFGLLGKHTDEFPINRAQMVDGALFVMCDSTVPGRNDGYLSNATLGWIDEQISAVGKKVPVFVCFHHPPVLLQMPFMDNIRQRGEGRLAQIAARHPNIVGFLCGHAHTGAVTSFAGRPVAVAPGVSSTLNLPCEGDEILNDSQPPGLAFHTLEGWRMITHFRVVALRAP